MLFNNQDWKLSVTDINLYENTVSLDGQSYPLSSLSRPSFRGICQACRPPAAKQWSYWKLLLKLA